MDLILDTHALIWFFNGDNLLSEKARRLIEDPKNRKFVSIISLWEISIKIGIKKLEFDGGTKEIAYLINQNEFEILPIAIRHIVNYETLSLIHRDPFDRILVAQAQADKMTIITIDENIKKYKVKTLW